MNLVDWEDGHRPGSTSMGTKMAIYKTKCSPLISIFDNFLPEDWCNFAYNYSIKKCSPWGIYINTVDAQNTALDPESLKDSDPERAIALITTRTLLFGRGSSIMAADICDIHGTAVWCLTSSEDSAVEYHIDYAELYRYETNVILPPIFGATVHVSNFDHGELIGGDLMVNKGGLDHYRRFGYKASLAKAEFEDNLQTDRDWETVRYTHNRAILVDGSLPHLATKITKLTTDKRRVILGLNCFPAVVGECCERAPEHSDAFNRTVRLYQAMAALGVPITAAGTTTSTFTSTSKYAPPTTPSEMAHDGVPLCTSASTTTDGPESIPPPARTTTSKGGICAKDLLANRSLAKMLVMAARKMRQLPPPPPPEDSCATHKISVEL